MRPRGYRPSDPNAWYDPVSGKRVSFDVFLKRADQILGAYDRAVAARDRVRDRLVEGVPQVRRRYWERRVRDTRVAVAVEGAFVREIDEQLSRPSAIGPSGRSGGRSRPRPSQVSPALQTAPERPPGPHYAEFELGLNYGTALAHAQTSVVDINVRFSRADGEPITMNEAWEAVRAYRLSGDGQFPREFVVQAINWQRLRRGRRYAATTQEILDALHDFLFIAMSMDKSVMTLDGLRLGSIKEG